MAVPRIVYFTAKRFGSLCLWVVGGMIFGLVAGEMIVYSNQTFDSPWPPVALLFFLLCVTVCYNIAQIDVEREQRENERVLDTLSKE